MIDRYNYIQGPEIINLNERNFYDQSPFEPLFSDLAQTTGADLIILKRVVTRIARKYAVSVVPSQEGQLETRLAYLSTYMSAEPSIIYDIRSVLRNNKSLFSLSGNYTEALKQIGNDLSEFPFWLTYIKVNLSLGDLGNDGSKKGLPAILKSFLPPSYASWVTKRLASVENAWLLGLEEVVPARFPEDLIQPSDVRTDRTRGHQRWAILKASEIIQAK